MSHHLKPQMYVSFGIVIALALSISQPATGNALGWIQLPLRWAVVDGSPIAEGADPTSTLMSRLRGANVLMGQARISLMSGLRDRTEFPIISDPDLPDASEIANGALPGDVRIGGVLGGAGQEVRQLRRNTRRAYGAPLVPRRRRGIFAIAAGRFNDDDGSPTGSPGVGGVIGMAWQFRRMLIVEDPARRGRSVGLDRILVAHEASHVLTLDHTTAPFRVMQATIGPTNLGFSAGEIIDMRGRARGIRGARVDPPGVFDPGPVLGDEILDLFAGDEHPTPPPEYLDLDAAGTLFDQETNRVTFEQELWGLIPEANFPGALHYWTLVDADNNAATGAAAPLLGQIGVNTAFNGTDLAIHTEVSSDGQMLVTQGNVWEFENGQIFDLVDPSATFSVDRDFFEPVYDEGGIPDPNLENTPISDMIVAELDNAALRLPFAIDQPYRMQMILQDSFGNVGDMLDEQEQGLVSIFTAPEVAHAFVVDEQNQPIAGRFSAGETVTAVADGLLPDEPFELWVGDHVVAAGTTGPGGDAAAQFEVSPLLAAGMYPLSFVNVGTGIAADNVLEILPSADFDGDSDVDGDDFLAWQTGFGTDIGASRTDGDADGDGDVDGDDFLAWQSQFSSAAGRGSVAGVPEPDSVWLGIVCSIVAVGWLRRGRT